MPVELVQTDTAAPAGFNVGCSGRSAATATDAREATAGGSAGATAQSVTIPTGGSIRAGVAFQSQADDITDPDGDVLAGDYVVRLNITSSNNNIRWVETHLCERTSGGSYNTIASLTGQTTGLGSTGVVSHTIANGSDYTPSAGSTLYFVLCFDNTLSFNPETFQFTPDQNIDIPGLIDLDCIISIGEGIPGIPIPDQPDISNRRDVRTIWSIETVTEFLGQGDDLIVNLGAGGTMSCETQTSTPSLGGGRDLGSLSIDVETVASEAVLESAEFISLNAVMDVETETPTDPDLDVSSGLSLVIDVETTTVEDDDELIVTVPMSLVIDVETETPTNPDLDVNPRFEAVMTVVTDAEENAGLILQHGLTASMDACSVAKDEVDLGPPGTCRPARAHGHLGRLIIQDEEEWGVLSANQVPWVWEVTNENLDDFIDYQDGLQSIGGGREGLAGRSLRRNPTGQITGEVQERGPWMMILRHALTSFLPNSDGSGGNPTVTVHQLTGANTLPPGFTLEKRIGFADGTAAYLRYMGCRVNAFTLRVPRTGYVTATVDIIAKEQILSATSIDDAPELIADNDSYLADHSQISLEFANDLFDELEPMLTATSFTMTIRNNLSRDGYTIDAGRNRSSILVGNRRVSGELSIFVTRDNYRLYQRAIDNASLEGKIILFPKAGAFPNVVFTFGKIQIRGTTPKNARRGPLDIRVPFVAHSVPGGKEDGSDDMDIAATVFNSDAILSTAQ